MYALALLAALAISLAARGMDYHGNPDNYRFLIPRLKPGDTLQLAAGSYRQGLWLHDLEGTRERPITIRGSEGKEPTRFVARDGANTVSLSNAAYLIIESLELDGQGRNADAVKAEGTSAFSHHITLSRLAITGHDADQSIVGINVQSPAWDWIIQDCVIRGAGTGMYLGRSEGTGGFVGGIIQGNIVTDTIGYNLQIKHQKFRAPAPGMPHERRVTIIRHNVFSKRHGGSTGQRARPNVLVGHFPLSGAGADDLHIIYANVFYDNPNEALFQGEGNIALYDNVFVNPSGAALHIQPHNARPRYIDLFHNTVLARGDGIVVAGVEPNLAPQVVANVVFAERPLVGVSASGNIALSFEEAGSYLRSPYVDPPLLDVSPLEGMLRGARAVAPRWEDLPAQEVDFDGIPRTDTLGAFEYRPKGRPISLEYAPHGSYAAAQPSSNDGALSKCLLKRLFNPHLDPRSTRDWPPVRRSPKHFLAKQRRSAHAGSSCPLHAEESWWEQPSRAIR